MKAKQLSVVPFFEDLDHWEVITGCHQNRTSVSQLIETLVYFGWFGVNPVIEFAIFTHVCESMHKNGVG